ncbi:hypothetical protein B0H14DRAFT_1351548 [Mycena olivaceomarginata]|nr:hypothetical protein B0H14DRAFT_1351548 [Mycena olivaceomarginata]
MVSTMNGNEADLPDLIKRLKSLTETDTVGCSDNLKQRLDKLKENLEPITTRLRSLEKKSKIKQLLKGKKYEKEIQDIKASITFHIEDFTFHNNISVKILVDPMSTTVGQVDRSVQKIEPQRDRRDPSGGDRRRGQTLTVNNYISGGTGGPGGLGIVQGTGGDGGPGKGPTLNYTINKVENFTTVNSNHVEQTLARIKYISAHYNAPNTPRQMHGGYSEWHYPGDYSTLDSSISVHSDA